MFDRFLKFVGKKRGVRLPGGAYQEHGPYVYAKGIKEPFWRALLRPSQNPLPDDLIDLFELAGGRDEVNDKAEG
jgi:hypothetical protein